MKQKPNPLPIIIFTGLLAGTLDIAAACIQYYSKTGKNPSNVLRYIASAVFGKSARTGGTTMAAWGLGFHFLIAFIFTIFFFVIFPLLQLDRVNKFLMGFIYGVFVWIVMNLAVLPLVFQVPVAIDPKKAGIAMAILIVCIGMPISILINRYYSKKVNGQL